MALFAGMEVSRAAFVIDQIGTVASYDLNSGPGPTPSQIFTDFPDYSCMVLEDFAVTAEQLEVTHVSALFRAQGGFVGFQSVNAYALSFFSDPALASVGLSGDIASLMVLSGAGVTVTPVIDGGGTHEYGLVSLNVNVLLPSAGQYWVGLSPVSASSVSGQFLLLNSGAADPMSAGNAISRFANPGDGFGLGEISAINLDHAYSVTAIPEPSFELLAIPCVFGWLYRRKRVDWIQ